MSHIEDGEHEPDHPIFVDVAVAFVWVGIGFALSQLGVALVAFLWGVR